MKDSKIPDELKENAELGDVATSDTSHVIFSIANTKILITDEAELIGVNHLPLLTVELIFPPADEKLKHTVICIGLRFQRTFLK